MWCVNNILGTDFTRSRGEGKTKTKHPTSCGPQTQYVQTVVQTEPDCGLTSENGSGTTGKLRSFRLRTTTKATTLISKRNRTICHENTNHWAERVPTIRRLVFCLRKWRRRRRNGGANDKRDNGTHVSCHYHVILFSVTVTGVVVTAINPCYLSFGGTEFNT